MRRRRGACLPYTIYLYTSIYPPKAAGGAVRCLRACISRRRRRGSIRRASSTRARIRSASSRFFSRAAFSFSFCIARRSHLGQRHAFGQTAPDGLTPDGLTLMAKEDTHALCRSSRHSLACGRSGPVGTPPIDSDETCEKSV